MARRLRLVPPAGTDDRAAWIRWRDTAIIELGRRVYLATVRENYSMAGDGDLVIATLALDAERLAVRP